jgi:hypothetical protein
MRHTWNRALLAVVAMLCVLGAVSLVTAQTEQTLAGTIDKVDAQTGSITLKTTRGPVELQAPAPLLSGLQAGDVVEVKMVGNRAMTISKKDAMQKPKQ